MWFESQSYFSFHHQILIVLNVLGIKLCTREIERTVTSLLPLMRQTVRRYGLSGQYSQGFHLDIKP